MRQILGEVIFFIENIEFLFKKSRCSIFLNRYNTQDSQNAFFAYLFAYELKNIRYMSGMMKSMIDDCVSAQRGVEVTTTINMPSIFCFTQNLLFIYFLCTLSPVRYTNQANLDKCYCLFSRSTALMFISLFSSSSSVLFKFEIHMIFFSSLVFYDFFLV